MDDPNDLNKNPNDEYTDGPSTHEPPESEAATNEPDVSEPAKPDEAESVPKFDFTEPWREPAYTSTNDNVKAYSPSHYDGEAYAKVKPPRRKTSLRRSVGFVLVCAVICSIFGGCAAYLVTKNTLANYTPPSDSPNQVILGASTENNNTGTTEDSNSQSVNVTGEILNPEEIYELACTQVVGINTSVTTNVFGQTSSSAVSGSGFIISADGYILTNYHVVEYAVIYDYEMSVMLYNGTSYPAEVVGYETDNDVAVVKIDATDLHPVALGNSSQMKVGERVYTVGNPLGELEFTMTEGIISALDRYVTTDENTSLNMFQIDAAVNSGNSGGPVYNSCGKVIGIVTAKYSSTGVEGLGFAIPIDDAVNISTQLIEQGYVSGKAYLGVNVQEITETYAYYLNLPRGAYVYSINDESCAVAAGIKVGDVITAVGDYTVESVSDLKSALNKFSSGDTTVVTVYRSGESLKLNVTFDEREQDTDSSNQGENNDYWSYWGGYQIP